jgi:hypothetical protein
MSHSTAQKSVTVTEDDLNGFFRPYDAVAKVIMSGTAIDSGFGCNNCTMVDYICDTMDWSCLDLFAEHDFDEVYAQADEPVIQAYAMIAFLREQVFRKAEADGIGFTTFNQKMWVYANVWQAKLIDLLRARRSGEKVQHRWVN